MIQRFEQFSASIACIYRQIQKIERTEMARYGLKGPHAQCMLAMSRCPEGVTAAQLCDICEKDKAAISRTVSELEAAGMVSRQEKDGKRYRVQLQLTEQGQQIAAQVNMLVARAVEQAGTGLKDADREAFYRALDLIAGNIRQIGREGIPQ